MSAIQGRRKAIVLISEGRRLQPVRHFHRRRPVEFQFRKLQHDPDRDVGHDLGRIAQQRADLHRRSSRPHDDGPGRHRDRWPGGRRLQPRAQAAFPGTAVVAAESPPAFRGNGRRGVRGPQRLRRRVRSHRAGEQPVLRARVLLDQREAGRQAAQHHGARRRLPGRSGRPIASDTRRRADAVRETQRRPSRSTRPRA